MVNSKLLLAVAGSGKTESIVTRCVEDPRRRLIVTYTEHGQRELENRLRKALADGLISEAPEVIGWYSFLIENFLKPYLPIYLPGQNYRGFNFDYSPGKYAKGDRRYFDHEGRAGRQTLGYIARMINEQATGWPIARLEKIYEEIVFDEVQDLAASDLVIIENLLKSSIRVYMVGDPRQIVYETTTSDTKYRKYRGVEKVTWYREREARSLLEIEEQCINYRSNQEIVDLANQVFNPALSLADAISGQTDTVSHRGIFRITEADVADYCMQFNPLPLRWNKSSAKKFENFLNPLNFGDVKGLQADHVLIFPTTAITKFVCERQPIEKPISAAKLYVAITRARHSVAFVLPPNVVTSDMQQWTVS